MGNIDDAAIAFRARSWFVNGAVLLWVGVWGTAVFTLENIELGWRVELLERKDPDGVLMGGAKR